MKQIAEWTYLLKSDIRDHVEHNHSGVRLLRYFFWFLLFLTLGNIPVLLALAAEERADMLPAYVQLVVLTIAVLPFRRWRIHRHIMRDMASDADYWANRIR